MAAMAAPCRVSRADAITDAAQATLYTDRQHSLRLLEQAVRSSPHNILYWEDLIHALDVDSEHRFADWAARQALRLNPREPRLLIDRATLLHPEAAQEFLPQLAQVPGQQATAHRLMEFAHLGMAIPTEYEPVSYAAWADTLYFSGDIGKALEVSDVGLAQRPNDPYLLGHKAIFLAMHGEFEAALRTHQAAVRHGYTQRLAEGRFGEFLGIADCLLWKGQPAMAIRVFDGLLPRYFPHRRLLAAAYFHNGDLLQARRVLTAPPPTLSKDEEKPDYVPENPDLPSQVLLLSFFLQTGLNDLARQQAAEVMKTTRRWSQGSTMGPSLAEGDEGKSLRHDFSIAVNWLLRAYPKDQFIIKWVLGAPYDIISSNAEYFRYSTVPTLSRQRVQLRHRLAKAKTQQERNNMRGRLAENWEQALCYREAADTLAPLASERQHNVVVGMNRAAALWATDRRLIDTETLFSSDPWRLAAVRGLLAQIREGREYERRANGLPPLAMQEQVDELVHVGPAVLAPVFDQLQWNGIGPLERLPLIAVIKRLGTPADAPPLIATLFVLHTPSSASDASTKALDRQIGPVFFAADADVEIAINDCLATITGQPQPTGTREERRNYWVKWWFDHAATIVNEGAPRNESRDG
jgi:tetratricopeptide (TPR) repeat protein